MANYCANPSMNRGLTTADRRPYRVMMPITAEEDSVRRSRSPRSPASSSTSPTRRRGPSAATLAEQMQPAHPEDSSYAIAAGKLADRDFEVIPNADRPLTRETPRGRRRPRHRPPLRPQVGGDHQLRPPRSARRRARRARGVRPRRRRAHRPRRDRAGQVRQQPERPPRPLRHRDRERAPSRTTSTTTAPPRGCSRPRTARQRTVRRRPDASAEAAASTSLARVERGLLLPRRHARPPQRRRRPIARTFADRRRRPSAPLAAVAEHGDGPRRRPRRLRPLRRRLHRRARQRGPLAEPRLLGRPARLRAACETVTDSPAAADPPLGRAQATPSRSCAPPRSPTARSTRPSTTRRPPGRAGRGRSAPRSRGLARHFPHQRGLHRGPRAPTCATGPTAASRKPDFVRSIEAFRPERDRRDGIEHLVVFPMYKQNALAPTPASRR